MKKERERNKKGRNKKVRAAEEIRDEREWITKEIIY